MPASRKALIWTAALAAVFLFGFLPQFSKANSLRQQVDLCHRRLGFASLKNAIGLTYLEVNQKNYGMASQYASRFFDTARQMLGEASTSSARPVLEDALSRRDKITADLARGDPSVITEIQNVYGNVLRNLPE
jgi:hypothetical protein